MKMIIVQPYISIRGGFERVVLEIAQHYNASIYTLEYSPDSTFEGFKNVEIKIIGKDVPFSKALPYRASQGLRYGYNFYNLKIKEDYDLLNPHISPSEWVRHKNERVFWYCHTPPREVYDLYKTRMKYRSYRDKLIYASFAGAYKLIANRQTKKIEAIATNSEVTKERISKYFHRESTVINPGINPEDFDNHGDDKFFFYPSRIVANKRQEFAIEAFRRFVKKTDSSNYKLVLAGALSNDPEHVKYLQSLKTLAKGLNVVIHQNVHDSELKDLYSRCTAVLYPPINEDFGIVPLEGMASGKPIIAINSGGPKETIMDGKTGFLVPSPEEMADKMQIIANDSALAEQMGKEGIALVKKKYTWDVFFKKFDSMAKEVASGKK